MSKIVKVVALLSAMLAISCGKVDAKKPILREIIQILNHMTQDQVECGSTLVPDIFHDAKEHSGSIIFCKAAKALKILSPCKSIKHHLKNLRVNLVKAGKQTHDCTVNEHSEIELGVFLRKLKVLSQRKYSQ